ncbi:MAG TPA: hypothetical protein VE685_19510 [Thermoanaerobaculia bacterium]|nr:hypothetical protein [Thermoanaerobaculia bacterium]
MLSETQPVEPVSGAKPEMCNSDDADVVFEILEEKGVRESHHGGATDPKIPRNVQEAREAGGT